MSEPNQNHKSMGGEIGGVRESRDRLIKRLVDSGNDPNYARQKATEAAQKWDRRRG